MARNKTQLLPHPSATLENRINTGIVHCGDNLDLLSKIASKSVDLVYIDPPFNSNRVYEARSPRLRARNGFHDKYSSTCDYIDYMRPRCLELYRVLKSTGSFFYHCDWHAVHHVKVMLDTIFGEARFVNEIIWKRTNAHNDAKQGARHLGRVHDTLLHYSLTNNYTFNQSYSPYDSEYLAKCYKYTEHSTGRRYSLGDITAPNGPDKEKRNPYYEFLGVKRFWRFSKDKMKKLYNQGIIVQTKKGGIPRQKRYLDEGKGVPVGSVWDDIKPIASRGKERMGYPTQKPLTLLERIISIYTKPNDIVLDAFCGCGTAIVAAQLLRRQWIGMDINPQACEFVFKRLKSTGFSASQ